MGEPFLKEGAETFVNGPVHPIGTLSCLEVTMEAKALMPTLRDNQASEAAR